MSFRQKLGDGQTRAHRADPPRSDSRMKQKHEAFASWRAKVTFL
jgi:hypothetical protein